MSDPFKVVVVGPLAPYALDFHEILTGLGYSPDSASQQLQLVAHLSRWIAEQSLAVQGLSPGVVEAFFADRRWTYRNFRTPRSLAPRLRTSLSVPISIGSQIYHPFVEVACSGDAASNRAPVAGLGPG